jgi:hypothetical protein
MNLDFRDEIVRYKFHEFGSKAGRAFLRRGQQTQLFFIGKSPIPDLLSLSRNSHPYASGHTMTRTKRASTDTVGGLGLGSWGLGRDGPYRRIFCINKLKRLAIWQPLAVSVFPDPVLLFILLFFCVVRSSTVRIAS